MRGVRKTFGPKVAVDDLDLAVPEGAMYGFIGPNGAGKTTTIRMIMSILFPDRGELSVLGRASAVESKDRIGYLPEERGLYKKMKVGSFLAHIGRLKGMPRSGLKKKIHDWLERVDLGDVEKKKCEELSKGMQQKVQFIGTVLHEPDLIILDEPFSGLDPVNMRLLRDLIQEQNDAGRTVIFSTHQMEQAQRLCDKLVLINKGRKLIDGTMDEIRAQFTTRIVTLDGEGDLAAVAAMPGVIASQVTNGHARIECGDGLEPDEVLREAIKVARLTRYEVQRPDLHEIFVKLVGSDDADEAAATHGVSQ